MNGKTIYNLVPEIARVYNELIAILPLVAAHTKKFQFAMSQFHQFIQNFSQTATNAPLTQAHINAFQSILKYAQEYQQLFSQHFLQCWAHSVLENPTNYVPTTLCQIATGLQEATMDLDPVGARAFDSSSPQWLQYHILDLKAIDSSLKQYQNDPRAEKNVLPIITKKIESITNFINSSERGSSETGGIVFSPIPLIYQNWRLLNTDFTIGQQIGQGVSAFVYKGRMKETGEEVAIKALKFEKLEGAQLATFQRELSILASAQHECLLRFVGATDTLPFCIVTEWMPGSTLFADLNQLHNLSPTDRSIAMFDLARGMKFLHSRHIIHRDLKSLNVLIDAHKRVKIADFGLSRFTTSDETMTNNIGTPHWMAPELLGQDGTYDMKVDVYAYAILLWEICSSSVPYKGIAPAQVIARVIINDMRPPVPENATPALKQLIVSAWQRDPTKRPTFVDIVNQFKTGKLYITGTNIHQYREYIQKTIQSETNKISTALEELLSKESSDSEITSFLEENGVPTDKIEECWEAVNKMENTDEKAKSLAIFLQTQYASKASEVLRKIPANSLSKEIVDQIIAKFPSGDEESDTSLFICACKKGCADQVLLRAVSPQHIKVGFEIIARNGLENPNYESVVDLALKYASDSDPMMRVSAIRCLTKLQALDRIPVDVILESLKSQEPTLVSVATAALSVIGKFNQLSGATIDSLISRSENEPLAGLALVNACSNPQTAKEILSKNLATRLHPIIASSVLLKASTHRDLKNSAKQQLERLLPQIQDKDIVKDIKQKISTM